MKRWIWSLCVLPMAAIALGGEKPAEVRKGEFAPAARTIYVPIIKTPGLDRREALQLTEVVIKEIERTTPYKVVGSPDEADLVFEGAITTNARPAR